MKKPLLFLLFIFCFLNAFTQQPANCSCNKREIRDDAPYSCDTTVFKNGAKLYWQWNCDSVWLTFENKEKHILKVCEETDVYLCQKTGLTFIKEYPNYLLFIYEWISGCCTPPDVIFVSKETGKEIKRISNDLFVWGDADEDYIVYFTDTTFTKLVYLNHVTDKQYTLTFEKGKILKLAHANKVLELNELFDKFAENEAYLTFDLKVSETKREHLKIKIK